MSNYIEKPFDTYACANGHYFAIKFQDESRLRILPFSNMLISFPDGSHEKIDFDKMEVKDWKKKEDERIRNKDKISIMTHCFVCDEIFTTFKTLK